MQKLIWDNHVCLPLRPGDTEFLPRLEEHRRAGTLVVVVTIGFDQLPWHFGIKMLATVRTWVQSNAKHYRLIASAEDVEACINDGKLGICFNIEGGNAVDDLPALIEPWYALGVRWMLIAYNNNNALGGGCQDEDTGLTAFGRSVIDEMERVGMVLCCSHTGHKTAREAIEYSNQPVIFSHSNPSALVDHPRNIPDDLIKACAATGGVININGIGPFLGENDNSTETFVKHVDYVANLVGPEYVGMGLDYVYDRKELDDYIAAHPELFPPEKGYDKGMKIIEPSRIPAIKKALAAIGWTGDEIAGFLGENNFRVAKRVWK